MIRSEQKKSLTVQKRVDKTIKNYKKWLAATYSKSVEQKYNTSGISFHPKELVTIRKAIENAWICTLCEVHPDKTEEIRSHAQLGKTDPFVLFGGQVKVLEFMAFLMGEERELRQDFEDFLTCSRFLNGVPTFHVP